MYCSAFVFRLSSFVVVLVLLLAGCGDDERPVARPTSPLATPRLVETQQSEEVSGEQLPGTLLFVRAGVVWRWQDGAGRALFGDGKTLQPVWSPAGDRIAYVQRGDSSSDLFVANADGALLAQVTDNSGDPNATSFERVYQTTWAFYPAWSPDGARLLYAGQYAPPTGSPASEYNLSLFETGATGGRSSQVVADAEAHCGRPVYTPDGGVIYVRQGSIGGGVQQLYRLAPGATVGQPLAGAPEGSYDPALSRDGAWLAFAHRSEGQTDIWALPAGGGRQPMRLTTLGSARSPAFSPDGSLLAFLAVPPGGSGFELWVANIERDEAGTPRVGEPRQVTEELGIDGDSGVSWGR